MPRGLITFWTVVAALCLAGCGQLDKSELSTQVESLQSLAQEGTVLAHGIVEGSAHSAFVRVHAEEMATSASDVADQLSGQQVPADLEADVRQTKELAKRVSDELEELSHHPDDREKARSIEAALKAQASQMESLRGGSQ